jgi:hypothetical protein
MSRKWKFGQYPYIAQIVLVIAVLVAGILACNKPVATQEVPPIPATQIPSTSMPPAVPTVESPPQPTAAQAQGAPLENSLPGFWRTKIVGKEVIVFEFQDGGKVTWNYHYNNGLKKTSEGSYTISGSTLTVDMGTPQDLQASLEGDVLTLTGPDGKVLVLQKVAGLDTLSPSASQNIAQDIIARWQDAKTQEWLEFKADGTVVITSGSNTITGTYKVTANQVEMKMNNQGQQPSTLNAEIDGSVLTLIAQDGTFIDYTK